ncbi:MAG: LuxR C-terminal-related transcriptional regulator [Muricomes sp.]
MRREIRLRDKYYFPNRLTKKLEQMSQYPLTIVEAPSGFGKTTAVREHLKELPGDTHIYWYTCLGKSVQAEWEEFCGLFVNTSDEISNRLKNFGIPTIGSAFNFKSFMKSTTLSKETYIVVDNYHLVAGDIANELLDIFSMHENINLHIIVITQNLNSRQKPFMYNHNIHAIDAGTLFFDKDGTDRLLRLEGIRLGKEELDKMFHFTEGWVSAICLQAVHLKENGVFSFSPDMEQLVENAIWHDLDAEEKEFLLSVSVLHSFSTAQAAVMLGQDSVSEKFEKLLKNNDFIQYFPDSHIYCIHNTLQEYLQNRFYHFCTEEYRRQVFCKAGASCAAVCQNFPAAEFYYKTGDFDAILSLPFTIECLDKQKEKYQFEFIIHIADECPEEIWCKYPYAMLAFGYYALMLGQRNAYQKLTSLLQRIIQERVGFDKEELRRIEGEFILLTAAASFNDAHRVMQGLGEAYQLLEGPSQMITPNVQWMFATPSVLNLFWCESGQLEAAMEQWDDNSHLCEMLTNKQGIGYHLVMRAEAMLLRGDTDEAEILCHEARYLAHRHKQTSMCICADFVLTRIALLNGDTKKFFASMDNLEGYLLDNSSSHITSMVEYCMSLLGVYLCIEDYIAPWMYDLEQIQNVLYAPIVPFAQIIHLGLLLMQKQYHKFYGLCNRMLDHSEYVSEDIQYMMPQLYALLLMAAAEHSNGRQKEAEEFLEKALDIALPDQVYLPFSYIWLLNEELSDLIIGLFNTIENKGVLLHERQRFDGLVGATEGSERTTTSGGGGGGGGNAASLKSLYKRHQNGVKIIRKAVLQRQSPLTPREREVALLARERLTAAEIADELFISQSTVKTILHSVYTKLDVHSRAELAAREI